MNRPSNGTPDGGAGQTLTIPAPAPPAPPAPQPGSAGHRACNLVRGSGAHLTDEMHCLLHNRLRMASVIAWTGYTAFLVRNFLLHGEVGGPSTLELAVHCGAVAVLTLLTSWLWSNYRFAGGCLRRAELIFFGTMAAHFAFVQFIVFHDGRVLEWAAEGHRDKMLTLVSATNALRWFILIVLYGTFIPNTWKRCTVVVGVFTAIPLVMTFAQCIKCPYFGAHTWTALLDMVIILGVGAAIAIFGSYKIGTLQAEAFAARKLGQYQLRERLGAGGMGEVYLGEHVLLRRQCAIKLIRPEQAGDPTNLTRFEREVRAMATLTHWNTVEIYDYGRADDGTFYYVMEYLPGMSLQELVENHGLLSPGRAIHFLRQICAALQEAHGIGLIHRDIKPSNVLICQRGGVHDVAKLLDFGLVHDHALDGASTKLTIQGAILGSPPYISPEQATGRAHLDARTDIYSLGGLAYYLLTGQAPFQRETAMELLVAHLREEITPPRQLRPELPEDLEDVILRCLQKKPEDRFTDIVSVDRALAACDAAGDWDADQAAQWWGERDRAKVRKSEPESVPAV